MGMDHVDLVRSYWEEVRNKGNLAALSQFVSDRYAGYDPIVGDVRGMDALREELKSSKLAFPDMVMTIADVGMTGERVFMRWICRGTHRGSFKGIAPTNRKAEVHGISIDHVAGGKIVEHYESYDTLAFFQMLGAVPPLNQLVRAAEEPQPYPFDD
jgi:predicted ester cyclase